MGYTVKTPDYTHLGATDFEHVYEPAEDTFLLIDSLEVHAEDLIAMKPTVCVEVGCGPGLAITALGMMLQDHEIAADLQYARLCTAASLLNILLALQTSTPRRYRQLARLLHAMGLLFTRTNAI
eukprot:m.158090 g.158090  ORF g.158090 m.158090 type:complete len:124 (+) comp16459_c0_seq16:2151-2522(+)